MPKKRGPKPRGLTHLCVRIPTHHRHVLDVVAIERKTDTSAIVCQLIDAFVTDWNKARETDKVILDLIKSNPT